MNKITAREGKKAIRACSVLYYRIFYASIQDADTFYPERFPVKRQMTKTP